MGLFRQVREESLWVAPLVSFLLFVAGTIIGAWGEEIWGKPILLSSSTAVFTNILFLAVIALVLGELVRLMIRLDKKVGIKVRYVESDASGRVYVACRNVVEKATKSIFVVNSYLVEGHEYAAGGRQKAERKKYYSTLMQKAERGAVDYYRILQVQPDQSPLKEMREDWIHFLHLQSMAKRKKEFSNIRLWKAPASRLTTFVLIDGVHLIWQINEVDSRGQLNLQGAFIIHDPQRRITEHFLRYFDKLRGEILGSVEEESGKLV